MDTNTKEFPWMDTSLSPKERASLLVANMDLDQKINQLHGAMATIDIYATMDGIEDDEGMEKLSE